MGLIILVLQILLVGYLLISIFVLYSSINNPYYLRNQDYCIKFGIKEGRQEKKEIYNPMIRYWMCYNPKDKNEENWVILLHSWGRNSVRMISRAQPYWDNGYSLLFIDSRSHGQSSYAKVAKGMDYAADASRIVKKEGITNPIVHGLSYGAITAVFYAAEFPTKALVAEALINNFHGMFYGFLKAMKLPKLLFGWIPWLLLHWDFPWDEYEPYKLLKKINSPIFLIHGEKDEMFDLEYHFEKNCTSLNNHPATRTWIVPESPHSKMAQHPSYYDKLTEFIISIK